VTLELGIDLGQLESIIQLDAPHSVMSWLQRLGRSGRRGGPQEMRLVTSETDAANSWELPLPWQLLQSIAIIELYLQDRWIEPVNPPRYPYSLLYQQTMSTLLAQGELQPAELAQQVLSLTPFKHITQDDYRLLLQYLLEIDHLQRLETGALIVGLAGERIARNWRFFAVFQESEEYSVHDGSREIGSIGHEPAQGELVALAGSTWEVREVDSQRRQVLVKAAPGRAATAWSGSSATIHDRILAQMRQVLIADDRTYRYLQPQALGRLQAARAWAKAQQLQRKQVIPLGQGIYYYLPWCGSNRFRLWERLLRLYGPNFDVLGVNGFTPYYLTLQTGGGSVRSLEQGLATLGDRVNSEAQLIGTEDVGRRNKYDIYIPAKLLTKSAI
jgi:ATP-dependent Lhr-like helicase